MAHSLELALSLAPVSASVEQDSLGQLSMDLLVASSAQSDEILFGIITEKAARLNMMHLEFTHRSAMLAPPPISLEYLLPQLVVGDRIKPQPGTS